MESSVRVMDRAFDIIELLSKDNKKPLKFKGFLSSWPDLNRRPTHYECGALPAEPQKHVVNISTTDLNYYIQILEILQAFFTISSKFLQ